MNSTKREMLMQKLPAAADILALVPVSGEKGRNATVIHTITGACLTLAATTEYVLSCLAEREDKELRLIRQNASRRLARRRNIILPILHGCVLAPVVVRRIPKRHGRLGYINIAYKPLLAAAETPPTSPCGAAPSSVPSGSCRPCSGSYARGVPSTTSSSSTYSSSCAVPRSLRSTCIFPRFIV